jgi:hypothetical protein
MTNETSAAAAAKLLVNLRGTSGSGKTTIARTFMQNYPHEFLRFKSGKPAGVRVDVPGWNWPLYICGKYESEDGNLVCGGMDTIKTQALCADRAIKAYRYGHVLAEGLMASGVSPAGTFPQAIIEAAGPNVRFLFLDTPLPKCLGRVEERRRAKGNMEPLDPENTTAKWNSERSAFLKFEAAGLPAWWLPHERGYECVFKMLARADAVIDIMAAA